MLWCTLLCLVSPSLAGREQVLDAFSYPTSEAAAQAWDARSERDAGGAVRVAADGGRTVLELETPFATHPTWERVYMDRSVDLNLAACGEFELQVMTTDEGSGARLSIYFHSGRGWYGAGTGLAGSGWQKLRFPKTAFTVEQEPAGWHQIDTIRLAVWQGQPRDHAVRFGSLTALQNEVALIIPTDRAHPEYRSAIQVSDDVRQMLDTLGLPCDPVEDAALLSPAVLGSRRAAVLAHNPSLPDTAVAALVKFVEGGGKVLVCYQLPAQLAKALGFRETAYVRQDHAGQFSSIRFQAKDIQGLPPTVHQASWNITTAHPAAFGARVIGRWFDDQGRGTEYPAMLLSERGAFFSHIVLNDDRDNKARMLAAILGHLDPAIWQQMATAAIARAGQVGHLEKLSDLLPFLAAAANPAVAPCVQQARQELEQARQQLAAQRYFTAAEQARSARNLLLQAYAEAQPSRTIEGRAFWNHSGTGAYDGDWERTARELHEAGFNMILPNMLWGGRAHYPSDVLPRSRTYERWGDQIAQCVAACQKYGLEVHVWKVNWNLSGAPREFVNRIHAEHRNQVSADGRPRDWLCPSHPANFQLELDSMLEVATRYKVDGLHFDYIRYPGRDQCYCDGCRERFQQQTGRQIANWPADCYTGPLRDVYNQWRCDQITRLVQAVHREAKSRRPEIQISAAVFSSYPSCRMSVAQDWPRWIEAGYLDFVCPMDYSQNDAEFISLVTNQLQLVQGKIPVYPGVGQWRLSDDRALGQIYHARRLGGAGFTLFNLTEESIRTLVPTIGQGVGRQAATPPHCHGNTAP